MTKKKNISSEDLDTWKKYIENPKDLIDKDKIDNNQNPINRRFIYDLHGLTLNNANEKVKSIIISCAKKKIREILFITGKGIHSKTYKDVYASEDLSKLRFSVPAFIRSNDDLMKCVNSISVADQKDGGDGAIIIRLKKL